MAQGRVRGLYMKNRSWSAMDRDRAVGGGGGN